ncbi:virulence factor Mce family protein [Klenkia soli]|uniref:Virulence factor Mce family protein n=1 Tax=Klenkia soli TaxID=1052260 RepID=A0A1H0D4R2_9ACTN|nr:MCE family protein [Klenkia soli]SDN65086.1 virulence factor Mce family protein [Klenkia soli]
MSRGRGAVVRQRLQGVAFLAVILMLLGLAVATYQKAFSGAVTVQLETDTIGNQLQTASDVKIRGVIVGEVRAVSASADGATIELAIQPEYLDQIPANVNARLLPKTLFGERFVSLVIPDDPSEQRLAGGDTIGQDRSENAIELERVIDDLLPLLQAVDPGDLSYTLGAVADALRGRGDQLGQNLADTGSYVGSVNTVLPQLQADISLLADTADTYEAATPDLLAVLDNLSVTASTVVDQSEQLRRTFTVVGSSAQTAAGFLQQNESSLIQLAQGSRPVLSLFARYSPEYPCLLNGLSRFNPMISEAFGADGDPALNLNLTVTLPPRNPYVPGDQPAYDDVSGPDCRGLDDIDGVIAAAAQGEYYCPVPPLDGVDSTDNPVSGNPRCLGGTGPTDLPFEDTRTGRDGTGVGTDFSLASVLPRGLTDGGSAGDSLAGSSAELDFVRSLLGYQTGVDPTDVSDLAASSLAPLLRGTQVMVP